MPKYCFDTSGISKPYEQMPEDIHTTMWDNVRRFIADGNVAVTAEIIGEMVNIGGKLGSFIEDQKSNLVFEVNADGWNWEEYVEHSTRMQNEYYEFISEYNGGSKKTVGLNDLSIVALAKTLKLPVLSSETRVRDMNSTKLKIPNLCDKENITHIEFNDFLRNEGFINL